MVAINTVVAQQEGIQEHLRELFKDHGLFPQWTTVVATVLAMLILLLVLGKLVYKPVKKMVKERREFIQNNIDEATKQNNQASIDREKANEELMQARMEAAEIIAKAKLDADKVKDENISKAKTEASQIVNNARSEIEREKIKFEQESKQAIVEVALEAAKKVVEKEVDNATNRKIVNDFIKAK